ncbi:DISARM system phospholipase D-like protein DrmC [Embleya sp. NPDC050493]|uniref:DISARM system phospholipase D-like protein DrmC n=1 Tax=Embleya sp. NPDC050493 TaxID=3363989 RepID=UPI003795199F
MSRVEFESATAAIVEALGLTRAKDLVGLLARERSREYVLATMHVPAALEPLTAFLDARDRAGVPDREAAAYVRGYIAGWTRRRDAVSVQTVWSGPPTAEVPVRATAQVLVEVVREAAQEFVAMTYSARVYAPLVSAMRAAVARGVRVDVVVETRAGAGGLLSGPEPARAFAGVPGVRIWHWPTEQRSAPGARQHAKVAVADGRVLFLGSANLTASGASRNIEAGLIVRGGTAPQRAVEHIRELQRRGLLQLLADSGG